LFGAAAHGSADAEEGVAPLFTVRVRGSEFAVLNSEKRMAIAGRFPGGRPLRRRRETVLIYGRQRLRGIAALHACTFIVATNEMAIAGSCPPRIASLPCEFA
jgi:hypothetical protein